MSDARLILVKHSLPAIVDSVPSARWLLSAEGERRARVLGQRLAAYRPAHVASSAEPKAAATAEIAAREFGCLVELVPGLHENDRTGVPHLPIEEYNRLLQRFFDQPGQLVVGAETADQAHARFAEAVNGVIDQRAGTVVVVAHGTVITLLVSRRAGISPFALWQQLDLPSYIVLSRPGLEVVEIVPNLAVESAAQPRVVEIEE